jgi:hypothetical protein
MDLMTKSLENQPFLLLAMELQNKSKIQDTPDT